MRVLRLIAVFVALAVPFAAVAQRRRAPRRPSATVRRHSPAPVRRASVRPAPPSRKRARRVVAAAPKPRPVAVRPLPKPKPVAVRPLPKPKPVAVRPLKAKPVASMPKPTSQVGRLAAQLYATSGKSYLLALQELRVLVADASATDSANRASLLSQIFAEVAPQAKRSPPVRNILLEFASQIAGRNEIPSLANLLRDRAVREMARFALSRMPYEEAEEALRNAIPNADADFQIALLNSVAEHEDIDAIGVVQPLLQALTPKTRLAALRTLGCLPDPKAGEILWNAGNLNPKEHQAALRAYLDLAERLLQHGNRAEALKMFTRYASVAQTSAERCAALSGRVRASETGRVPLLIAGLRARDAALSGLALRMLSTSNSSEVVPALIENLSNIAPALRPALVSALGERKEVAAREALMGWARDADTEVRLPALQALLYRSDVSNGTRAQLYHRALSLATSNEEKRTLLVGIGRIASPSSLPALRPFLNDLELRATAAAAMLPIADNLVRLERKQEAATVYEQITRLSRNRDLARASANRLRRLGVERHFAAEGGMVESWLVLGAMKGRIEWRTQDAFSPNATAEPLQAVNAGSRRLRWKPVPLDDPYGYLDLNTALEGGDNQSAYIYAEVEARYEQNALFKIGSDDDVVCWLNGERVYSYFGDRGWELDQDTASVHLKAGKNRILLKILNGTGGWGCSLRITNRDNEPLRLTQTSWSKTVSQTPVVPSPTPPTPTPNTAGIDLKNLPMGYLRTKSGLAYLDVVKGKGPAPTRGQNVQIHYVGRLLNGKKFDSSRDRDEPFYFTVGYEQVIAGLDEGVLGMRVGGKRRLIVPPDLGYKYEQTGAIPPNSTLIFDVELLSVEAHD